MEPQKQQKASNGTDNLQDTDRLEIVFYTDPLCCWSWAFEPQWRKLLYEFEGKVNWRYCMGGLIPKWGEYNDPMNSISRPVQMGPLWMEARNISGMPIQDIIWIKDPPSSSYPACIAVKCAELQSKQAGEKYLRYLREAIMLNGLNISKTEILLDVALTMEKDFPGHFNAERLKTDMEKEAGMDAFRKDLQEVRFNNIGRFPSLTITKPGGKAIIIVGYRPYGVLLDAIKHLAPELQKVREARDANSYLNYWGRATNREIQEALANTSQ